MVIDLQRFFLIIFNQFLRVNRVITKKYRKIPKNGAHSSTQGLFFDVIQEHTKLMI